MPHDPPHDPRPDPIRTGSAFPATAPLHAEPTCARILEVVHRQLSIDKPWTHRTPEGFTWWPGGGVRQHVRAEGPIDVEGLDTWWLTLETPVWRGGDAAALAPHVEALRVAAHGAAVVHDAASGRTSLVTRTYLLPESIVSRGLRFAALGVVQARLALDAWAEAAAQLGVRAVAWRDLEDHPERGPRDELDEVLALPEAVFQPRAAQLGEAGLRALLATTARSLEAGLGRPQGDVDDSILFFAADLGPREGLVVATTMEHALVGPSVAASLIVDGPFEPDEARALGDALQRRALAAPSVQWTLGSWVVRPRMGEEPGHLLVHSTFLPLAVFDGDRGLGLASAIGFEVAEVQRAFGEGVGGAG